MPHIFRYPQAWKRQPGFHLLPPSQKTCFPSRLGKAGLISSSAFCFFLFPSSFFSKALEDNAWLQRRVEVPGWSSWTQHTSDTPPSLTGELGTLNFLSSCS